MHKRLTLKTERLASLSDEDLRLAAGGAADERTGRIECFLSIGGTLCTVVNCINTVGS